MYHLNRLAVYIPWRLARRIVGQPPPPSSPERSHLPKLKLCPRSTGPPPPIPSLSPPRDLTGVTLTALALRVCPASLSSVGCLCQNVLLLCKAEQHAVWMARTVPTICQQTLCGHGCVSACPCLRFRFSRCTPCSCGCSCGLPRKLRASSRSGCPAFQRQQLRPGSHPPPTATTSLCKRHHPDLGNPPSACIGLSATRSHVPHHLLIFSSLVSRSPRPPEAV